MASVTWAKFAWNSREGQWAYCGMTPHDELVSEWEEGCAADGIHAAAVGLDAPSAERLAELGTGGADAPPRIGADRG